MKGQTTSPGHANKKQKLNWIQLHNTAIPILCSPSSLPSRVPQVFSLSGLKVLLPFHLDQGLATEDNLSTLICSWEGSIHPRITTREQLIIQLPCLQLLLYGQFKKIYRLHFQDSLKWEREVSPINPPISSSVEVSLHWDAEDDSLPSFQSTGNDSWVSLT